MEGKFTIVTLDGRHPRDGGKRVGYIAGDTFYGILPRVTIPLGPPPPPLPSLEDFAYLTHGQECPVHWRHRLELRAVLTRGGIEILHHCHGCGCAYRRKIVVKKPVEEFASSLR